MTVYSIICRGEPDLTGQATPQAARLLDKVRTGEVKGVIHYLIIYEIAYHWRRGRLPFKGEDEMLEFIEAYFDVEPLDVAIAVEASRLKVLADAKLRSSGDPHLRGRRLSVSDATTLALALKLGAPIITGDADLSYAARLFGVEVIW
jgi:predicted nucleic acid-binding protein